METEPPTGLHTTKVRRWMTVLTVIGAVAIVRALLTPDSYTDTLPSYFLHQLPVGWWAFVKRTVPEIQLEPSAILFALIAFVIGLAMTHTIGRYFPRAWRWRSSIASTLAPMVLFAITISAGGLLMRTSQLVSDPRPIEELRGAYFAWMNVEMEMKERIQRATAASPKP